MLWQVLRIWQQPLHFHMEKEALCNCFFLEFAILYSFTQTTMLCKFDRCHGGANIRAWKHVMRNGICTGGPYGYKYCREAISAASAYFIQNNEKAIRREIWKSGPVHAAFDTYGDIKTYDGGIYKHTAGERRGGHSIKIIGWGNERMPNGTVVPYWIIANSWSHDWGEKGRFLPHDKRHKRLQTGRTGQLRNDESMKR
ncbi:papain family cysteine protease [Ancylostoma caninum]|uniref:Papain family cysteine protease n=1 Tax=Ancylostoma caninum TaxID=29170 RepID=A0A368GWG3_ANCCA|nr:papain family cysteine protease [Ancylostoma caninum]